MGLGQEAGPREESHTQTVDGAGAECIEARCPPTTGLTPGAQLLFALAAGLSVANIYYAQPLLDAMARDFSIRPASIGLVVTVTQLGYALGLLFIVPLGDLVDRRRLIAGQGLLSALALVGVGSAPTATVLLAGMIIVGLLAVVVQVLVAFAATLASSDERGSVVGTVTSGVVIGILLARFVSGLLADLGGWRSVYLTSAGLTLVMAALLYGVLPRHERRSAAPPYPELVRSVFVLFREEPLLRVRAVLALLIFATFSVLWTSMVLPLSAPPISLSHTGVGLFGLAGVAGAIGAGRAGRLADRGWGQWTTGAALALMLVAWLPIAFTHSSLWALAVGVVLLDLAIQAVHVTNQSMLLAVRPDARSRLIGGYMVFYSIGSASGSITSTLVYAWTGWPGVCALGAAISMTALLFWAATRRVT
ncbi:MFS permease protein [Cystobacter fuscus DSM 2262]|uniref:MFS permease protein n=1 Tax=Cystobacter fuscus (strain ATCC 25194 / DSM 2262 / NBRC 100088 / M29) TaxID=1242864 RepID=S9QDX1_CYSF2|nr:MFS transporter [Cystobacter fuscus]EPX59544.1 MFS permease protein [Cystobacter fuscus DSM 2262]